MCRIGNEIRRKNEKAKKTVSLGKYYADQFRQIPEVWRLAKNSKKRGWGLAFFLTVLTLLFPPIVYMMWLYDTGQVKIDERYMQKQTEDE